MTPRFQTKFSSLDENSHGNCFAACVASLLDVDIAEVPPFEDLGERWYPALYEFLKAHGYSIHGCRYFGERGKAGLPGWPEEMSPYEPLGSGVDGYYIVGGESPRGFTRGHCVLYKDGVMVHDPHPSGYGLLNLQEVYLISGEHESVVDV